MSQRALLITAVFVVLAAGCGGADRDSAPVTGKVTLKGQPVEGVIVRFQPVGTGNAQQLEAGMSSYGKTEADGTFTMRFTDDDSKGALIGEHTVVIGELTPPEEENNDAGDLDRPSTSRIPPKWTDGSQKYQVKEGSNEANFELSQ